jgi:hypothetical protein
VFAIEESSLKRDNIKSARSIRSQKLKVENMKKGKGELSAAPQGKSNHLSQKRKGNRASHQ